MTTTHPPLAPVDSGARSLLFTEARTANSFSDAPVTDAELSSIWELARWSPSAANTQPLRVLFVRTEEGKARLIPHLAEGNRAKAAGAPVVAVMAYDLDFHEHMPTVFPARGEQMRENLGGQPQLREGMARQSASLQTGVFLLAVRAAGLAAGPMGGFDAAGIDAEFFAGTSWRSHLVVNIGHPGVDPWFPRLPRLEHEQALAWA